jgi:phosphatidylinositol alpha-mannosyltransferase
MRGLIGIVDISANGSGNKMGILVSPFKVYSFFRELAFDILHVHEPLTPCLPYYASWVTPGLPKIATFHAYSESPPATLKVAAKIWGAMQLPFFSRAIAVSQPAQRHAAMAWKGPFQTIPNGVCTKTFRPGPQREIDGKLRLLFVGRLGDDRKGFRYLLAAYERLLARKVGVTLDVVGEAGATQVPDLPGLTYHGPVSLEELVKRYQQCDVFVAPSTGQESFGIVLLEAMATAKPIVCSAIDGYCQVVNSDNAVLVPPGDSEAIENAIVELSLSSDRLVAIGQRNRCAALGYDWASITPRIREQYCEVLEERRFRAARGVGAVSAKPLADSALANVSERGLNHEQ